MYLWTALVLWIDALHTYVYEYVHLSLYKIHTYKKLFINMYVFILPLKQGPYIKKIMLRKAADFTLSKAK